MDKHAKNWGEFRPSEITGSVAMVFSKSQLNGAISHPDEDSLEVNF